MPTPASSGSPTESLHGVERNRGSRTQAEAHAMEDAYFNTQERIDAYEAGEPRNAKYNLDLLASRGVTPATMAGRNVLDLGCGWGLLLKKFQDAGALCFGTDVSALSVSRCRERVPGISVEQADCTKNPFGKKFSLVMSFGVLGLVGREMHAGFLANAMNSLEKGGLLFATAPNAGRSGLLDVLSGKKRSVSYNNARTTGEWKGLLENTGFADIIVSTVLRLPKSEAVLGRNVFIRAGTHGDPIVISVRRRAVLASKQKGADQAGDLRKTASTEALRLQG